MQHLNSCLFCCLIVNLVYKVNGSGEMGFLFLRGDSLQIALVAEH